MQQMQKKTYQIKTSMKTKSVKKCPRTEPKLVGIFFAKWSWFSVVLRHISFEVKLWKIHKIKLLQFCKIILKNTLIEEFSSKF